MKASQNNENGQRTNERRYESNDSREIENCSISPELSDDSRDERYLRGQWPFSSEGEGCSHRQSATGAQGKTTGLCKLTGRYTPLSLTTAIHKGQLASRSCDALPLAWSTRHRAGIQGKAVTPRHTTHLILAGILTSGAANAESRRRLGSNSVDSLKSGRNALLVGVHIVLDCDQSAGAASKWISNRHGERCELAGIK